MTRYSNAILYKLKAKENVKKYLFNTFLILFIFQARGDSNHGGGCVTLQLRGQTGGASTKVAKQHLNENLSFFCNHDFLFKSFFSKGDSESNNRERKRGLAIPICVGLSVSPIFHLFSFWFAQIPLVL